MEREIGEVRSFVTKRGSALVAPRIWVGYCRLVYPGSSSSSAFDVMVALTRSSLP